MKTPKLNPDKTKSLTTNTPLIEFSIPNMALCVVDEFEFCKKVAATHPVEVQVVAKHYHGNPCIDVKVLAKKDGVKVEALYQLIKKLADELRKKMRAYVLKITARAREEKKLFDAFNMRSSYRSDGIDDSYGAFAW